MSTASKSRIVNLPTLEQECPQCRGKLSLPDTSGQGDVPCFWCDGWGVVPTEFGERVLELIKHNKSRLGIRQ